MRALPYAAVVATLAACARTAPTVVPVPLEGPESDLRPVAITAPGEATISLAGAGAPLTPLDALAMRRLILPVAGVSAREMRDSFDAERDEGARKHHAIDIFAPRNTPVLAADDGRILRMSTNTLGGITIYAVDTDNRFVYYYAHLARYHSAMTPGRAVSKGDTLGFVGTTGNAPKDTPHLHFQIMVMPEDGKYWNGEPINPYPLLRVER